MTDRAIIRMLLVATLKLGRARRACFRSLAGMAGLVRKEAMECLTETFSRASPSLNLVIKKCLGFGRLVVR